MHEACICDHGEPCYHEAYVFSVGETASKSVEMNILQRDGRLSKLTISNFSSWKKSADGIHLKSSKDVRGFYKTVMIDRIVRYEHGLTIECTGIALLFFGNDVSIADEDVRQVERPTRFGDGPGEEYRRMYLPYFEGARPPNH